VQTGHHPDISYEKKSRKQIDQTIPQMSFPTGGKALSSSRSYRESHPTDDSGAASLSSQFNRYNSELASSSQPCGENTFYDDGNRYSLPHNHDHGDQQQQLRYELEQMHPPLVAHSLPRSNPIAIKRVTRDRKREVHESDIDDDDSDIDVELDAIKLQRKYGNKIIQTYTQEGTLMQSSNARMTDKSSVLNAPYLGSLSRSSNQVLSLPPISLAGDSTFLGEPPDSIVSYGSLRDSQEQGRFLDGPSSYREPMSGKIRQLDHRLRYHGRQPELNIGERLQQSRKLRELRQKEDSKKKKEGLNGTKTNTDTENTTNKGEKKERKEAKSSLSAMMSGASQNVNTGGVDDFQEGNFFLSTERLISTQGENSMSRHSHEHRSSINSSPRNMHMLSTSLTAFEFLKTSNTDTVLGGNIDNPSYSATHGTATNLPMDFRNRSGFQPLARSMSDPSPRLQNLFLSEIPANSVLPAAAAATTQTALGLSAHMENAHGNHVQFHQESLHTNNYTSSLISDHQAVMFNGGERRSPHLDHDPITDGAFGDMDM
jgi:hypothetical protein